MAGPAPIRVMVVDDHAVVRSGLRLLLEREDDIHCAGEAASAEDAIRAVERMAPSVVLMDLQVPGMGGLAGIERLRQRAPAVPVLVLSMHDDPDDVRRAFAAGAAGYVLKTAWRSFGSARGLRSSGWRSRPACSRSRWGRGRPRAAAEGRARS